jgi:ABC-type branched-subunit amino acid transport system substrate-binding protein
MKGKIWLAVAALSLLGNACRADIGATDKEILIGACNVLSGPSQAYGQQTDIGINTLFNSVNAEGGIFGRKIRVLTDDDKYEPDGAIACFNRMKDKGVFAISGLVGSICLAKYLPMAENNKVPAIGYYPGPYFVSEPAKKYCFSARASYRDEMRQIVKHLWNDVGVRKIGVIYQNDSFGADCLEGVKTTLAEHGAEVVAAGSYTRNLNNIGEAFNTVKKANPEAVIIGAVYKPASEIAKLAGETNWHPLFVLNSGSGADSFLELAGKDAEGFLFTEVAPPPSRTDLPLVKNYQKALSEYFPKEKPNFVSLRGYIDAMVIAEGLKKAGKDVTREKFVEALEKINHKDIGLGKGMDLTYTPADHLGFHNVFFCWIKNGQVESFNDWRSLRAKKK